MFAKSKSLGFAALTVFAASLARLSAPLIAGFTEETFRLVPVALVFAVLGYLMIPNRRFMAWLTFYALFAGIISSIVLSVGPTALPDWWWMMIIAFDVLAIALVFIYLWRPKPASA